MYKGLLLLLFVITHIYLVSLDTHSFWALDATQSHYKTQVSNNYEPIELQSLA